MRLDDQLHHDVVEVRPMIPTVPSGDVADLFRGRLIAVVAPIDMNTGAIARRTSGARVPSAAPRSRP